jgi:Bifunctional DNA primase/polymerase, N-terminal
MSTTTSPSPPAPDLAAVLDLAGRGWRVFPCRSCDKTPLVREWQHVATTEEQQIRTWYEQHSGCNWGIATGRASDIWVLDVDGPKGEDSLKDLIGLYGPLPGGFTVRTGNGLHLYFALASDLRTAQQCKQGRRGARRAWRGRLRTGAGIHPSVLRSLCGSAEWAVN